MRLDIQSSLAVLTPDSTAVVFALVRSFKGIVDGGNDQDQPRDWGEDLVGEDGVLGVGRGLTERVCYCVLLVAFKARRQRRQTFWHLSCCLLSCLLLQVCCSLKKLNPPAEAERLYHCIDPSSNVIQARDQTCREPRACQCPQFLNTCTSCTA